MSTSLVALLPPLPGEDWSWQEVAAELAAYGHPIRIVTEVPTSSIDGDLDLAGAYVAHCALELAGEQDRRPVLLVAPGGAGRMLAAIGFSQKASRRRVVGYVLVDADLPSPGVRDWPDAPVTYIGTRQASLAHLRGWDLLEGTDLPADVRGVAAQAW